MLHLSVILLAGLALASCSGLPSGGPSQADMAITLQAGSGKVVDAGNGVGLVAVDVDANIARLAFRSTGSETFSGSFTDRRSAPESLIGPGDVLTVAVFESSAGGLFSPPATAVVMGGGNSITLPPQTVSRSGMITVPYAGQIRASGRSIADVQNEAVERLKRRAIEPQVVITMTQSRSNLVTVSGEVNAPTRITLNPLGDRVLDAIAQAGGSKWPAHETFVTLQRGDRRASVPMQRLISSPRENIFVRPGDTILAVRQQRHFLAFGASGRNGQIPFELDTLSLAEGVAKAGGLVDERAEPAMVFLYRQEPRYRVERYGVDLTEFHSKNLPVIYRFDLRNPAGFILAQNFPMLDKDIIYVANATSTDFLKAIAVIRGVTGVARDVEGIRRGVIIN